MHLNKQPRRNVKQLAIFLSKTSGRTAILFIFISFAATIGLVAWGFLLRNLCGSRKVKVFKLGYNVTEVFMFVALLFALLSFGAVKAVKACQTTFCTRFVRGEAEDEVTDKRVELQGLIDKGSGAGGD